MQRSKSSTARSGCPDAANARPELPGRDAPRAGDRYAVVLAAGPLAPEVLATRARMMELPAYTPEADEVARQLVTAAAKYQLLLDAVPLAEPDRELQIGEAQLASRGRVEVGPGLEVVRRDTELRREPPEGLHGRLARARFDPRDVRIGNSRRSVLALGHVPI